LALAFAVIMPKHIAATADFLGNTASIISERQAGNKQQWLDDHNVRRSKLGAIDATHRDFQTCGGKLSVLAGRILRTFQDFFLTSKHPTQPV